MNGLNLRRGYLQLCLCLFKTAFLYVSYVHLHQELSAERKFETQDPEKYSLVDVFTYCVYIIRVPNESNV